MPLIRYEPLVLLSQMRAEMLSKGITMPMLVRLLPIDPERLGKIASINPQRTCEPTLEEAWMIARALCTDGILPLIGLRLEDIDTTEDARGDLNVWRCGDPLPLSHGVRLTRHFGFKDPADLFDLMRLRDRDPILTGLWNMTPALGECPHCGGEGAETHTPDCLPNLLWGPRNHERVYTTMPEPRLPGSRRNGSAFAYGLAPLRKRLRLRQVDMAKRLGVSYSHYCKLDACTQKLTYELGQRIMREQGLTPEELYTIPHDPQPVIQREGTAPPPVA